MSFFPLKNVCILKISANVIIFALTKSYNLHQTVYSSLNSWNNNLRHFWKFQFWKKIFFNTVILFQMIFCYMPNKLKAFDVLFYQLIPYHITEHIERKKNIWNDLLIRKKYKYNWIKSIYRCTFTKWIFKMINASVRTVSGFFITICPVFTISTGSGTWTVEKSVITFYQN